MGLSEANARRELKRCARRSERGLFASQVTVCKLRDDRTIGVVTSAFDLKDE
jgi:hypothetical protein